LKRLLVDGMRTDDSPPDLTFLVGAEEKACRLDIFLSARSEDCSRSHVKKLIQEGRVAVNGSPVKASYEIRFGDRITVWLPEVAEGDPLTPEPMPLEILHEDDDILVLNKAPGVVVHPGAGHEEGTLVHGLLAHCPRLAAQGAPRRPGIVHRLDQGTSGALIVAKSDRAYLELIREFKDHEVAKEYLALVYGRMPQSSGEILTAMGRHPADRKKMAVLEKGGREAISEWRVETGWGEISLLRVVIKTGRTHQIRVHLSHIHHPVVGDETYGGGKRKARTVKSDTLRQLLLEVDRQMLHAWRLAFRHPVSGVELSFVAPLPPDFSELLRRIKHSLTGEGAGDLPRARAITEHWDG
jgi:23S rRNA pseudouridine1911/1915/1917 synthase